VLIGRGDRVEGLVKITDFGISHAAGDVTLTQTGQITGTPAFLAPEVAQGEEPRPPSDVFSLGATLYTCLEGEPPFGMTENALQLLHRVAGGEVTPPQHAGPLTRPLMQMLAADPRDRPDMLRVRDDLARLAAGRDGDTTTVLLARTVLRPAPGRSRTARFPSEAPVAAAPLPTPVPPLPVPEPLPQEPADETPAAAPPTDEPPPSGRRRRKALVPLVVAAAAVVIGVVLAVVLTSRSGEGNGNRAAGRGTTSSSTTHGRTPSTSAQTTASSAAATTRQTTQAATSSAPAGGTVTAADVRNFITSYYAMLPGNPQQAYDLTGPTLRNAESRDNYIAFWHRFSSVRLGPVTATDGSLVAHGSVTYVENGRSEPEQHTFTLVRGDSGQLLMDSDRQT
jgi:serine/threonine protein kinase